MTPYSYECEHGHAFVLRFPMGEAPRSVNCPEDAAKANRVYDAAIQFTYGKDQFHGPTLGERIEQQKNDFPTAEPVGSRWI